jgi:hypothetical protein
LKWKDEQYRDRKTKIGGARGRKIKEVRDEKQKRSKTKSEGDGEEWDGKKPKKRKTEHIGGVEDKTQRR